MLGPHPLRGTNSRVPSIRLVEMSRLCTTRTALARLFPDFSQDRGSQQLAHTFPALGPRRALDVLVAVAFLKVVELGEFVSGLSNLANERSMALYGPLLLYGPHPRSVPGHHWAIAVAHGAKRCYKSRENRCEARQRPFRHEATTHNGAAAAQVQNLSGRLCAFSGGFPFAVLTEW